MIVNGYEIKPFANLWGANLEGANLWGANLKGANLKGAYLGGAIFVSQYGTPNGIVGGYELIDNGQWAVGYRTKCSPYYRSDIYEVGQLREAPYTIFDDRECAPGLYVMPTVQAVKAFRDGVIEEYVKVIFRPWDAHTKRVWCIGI